jgi:hypothetical protein
MHLKIVVKETCYFRTFFIFVSLFKKVYFVPKKTILFMWLICTVYKCLRHLIPLIPKGQHFEILVLPLCVNASKILFSYEVLLTPKSYCLLLFSFLLQGIQQICQRLWYKCKNVNINPPHPSKKNCLVCYEFSMH